MFIKHQYHFKNEFPIALWRKNVFLYNGYLYDSKRNIKKKYTNNNNNVRVLKAIEYSHNKDIILYVDCENNLYGSIIDFNCTIRKTFLINTNVHELIKVTADCVFFNQKNDITTVKKYNFKNNTFDFIFKLPKNVTYEFLEDSSFVILDKKKIKIYDSELEIKELEGNYSLKTYETKKKIFIFLYNNNHEKFNYITVYNKDDSNFKEEIVKLKGNILNPVFKFFKKNLIILFQNFVTRTIMYIIVTEELKRVILKNKYTAIPVFGEYVEENSIFIMNDDEYYNSVMIGYVINSVFYHRDEFQVLKLRKNVLQFPFDPPEGTEIYVISERQINTYNYIHIPEYIYPAISETIIGISESLILTDSDCYEISYEDLLEEIIK